MSSYEIPPNNASPSEYPDLDFSKFEEQGEQTPSYPCLPLGELGEGEFALEDERCLVHTLEIEGVDHNVFALHKYEGEIAFGEHPNPDVQEQFELVLPGWDTLTAYRDRIRNLEDVNEKHEEVIARAQKITGLANREVKILDKETYEEKFGKGSSGRALLDISLIKDTDDPLRTIVHELNHTDRATSPPDRYIYTYDDPETHKILTKRSIRFGPLGPTIVGSNQELIAVNKFFEETSVELKTIQQLESAGEIDTSNPTEYIRDITVEGKTRGIFFPKFEPRSRNSGYAPSVHGLTLMEQCSPGLVDDLYLSRHDPAHFQIVIDRINEIQPGLYEKLRNLSTGEMSEGVGSWYINKALREAGRRWR